MKMRYAADGIVADGMERKCWQEIQCQIGMVVIDAVLLLSQTSSSIEHPQQVTGLRLDGHAATADACGTNDTSVAAVASDVSDERRRLNVNKSYL